MAGEMVTRAGPADKPPHEEAELGQATVGRQAAPSQKEAE